MRVSSTWQGTGPPVVLGSYLYNFQQMRKNKPNRFRNILAQATFLLYPAGGEMIIFGQGIHYMPILIIMGQKLSPEKGSYNDILHLFKYYFYPYFMEGKIGSKIK